MRNYEKPVLEIIKFEEEDVIRASGNDDSATLPGGGVVLPDDNF